MGRDKDTAVEEQAPAGEVANGVEKFSVAVGNEENARKLDLSFDFGGSTARAVELFGEEAVYNGFIKGAKVALQGNVRAKLSLEGEDAKTDDEILAEAADWKPGTRATRATSKTSKIEKLLEGMEDDEKAALLLKLQGMAGA